MSKKDLTGLRFGRLVVLKEAPERDKYGAIQWLCRCDCGNEVVVKGYHLTNETTRSCGCLRIKDLTGLRFGRWVVLKEVPERDKHGAIQWLCRCDCGNEVVVSGNSLRGKRTKSCGCLLSEAMSNSSRKDGATFSESGFATSKEGRLRGNRAYKSFREEILSRDNRTCVCLETGDSLHCHHYEKPHDDGALLMNPENVITLCPNCHLKYHRWCKSKNIDYNKSNFNEWVKEMKKEENE